MTITFNVSVAGDKSFLTDYVHPMQIMPQQRKTVTHPFIEQFPMIKKSRCACVHTSYVTRAFSEKILLPGFQRLNIRNYLNLANKIGFDYILIHGPESYNEWKLLYTVCDILHDIESESKGNAKIIIEMPAFKGSFIDDLKKEMLSIIPPAAKDPIKVIDYIKYYLQAIVDNGFEIVLDTAHMFANGCDVSDMIDLFKTFSHHMTICHLNGNKHKQYTSDAHCPIFLERNQIKDVDKLMKYLATTKLIMVTENASDGVEYKQWEQFAAKYKLKIVPYHDNLNC